VPTGSEPSQAGRKDATPAAKPGAGATGVAELARGLVAAGSFVLGATPADARAIADLARGALFLPVLGFGLGLAIGVGAAEAIERLPAVAVAPLVVAVLLAVQRAAPARALAEGAASAGGAGVALASAGLALSFVVKALAIASLEGTALVLALALAVMLGRWAIVVQAYGSIPAPGDDFAAALVPRIEFREFGFASVSAMAIALMLANAVGVVLVIASATVAVGLRILAHGRRGGVSRPWILAGADAVETTALALAALLAFALAG
jgi:hypothetical protein